MSDLPESAVEMAGAVAGGSAAPAELVKRALERIDAWQPATNAFSQVFAGEAAAEAREPRSGPLGGVPVAVKDLYDMAGHETTGCCAAYRGNVATEDADVVRALREAGAIIVGKTNQHELAFGTTNLISACGPAYNPWDRERVPGGSSGGSSAAVAAGVVPFALGTDTGGSIRIPASYCGVFGLKPTHGALSLKGVMPLSVSLDCPGPLAATAGDLALAWEVLSGRRADGSVAASVGVLDTGRCTEDVHEAVQATAGALEELGATRSAVPDGLVDAPEIWMEVAAPEFARDHEVLFERRDAVHPLIASFLDYGVQARERGDVAREGTAKTAAWFDEQLRDHEVLLLPATPYPAPRADDDQLEVRDGSMVDVHLGGASNFTRPVNLAGLPAVAFPAGVTASGLSVGVQLVGRRGGEGTLLATVAALEALEARFRSRRPPSP